MSVAGPSVAETVGVPRLHPRDKIPEAEMSRSTCAGGALGGLDGYCLAAACCDCVFCSCKLESTRQTGCNGRPDLRFCLQLRIPTKPAIDSDRNQPPNPIEASRGGGMV